ncbi:MAG: phosphate signaling complex protein PhoU [Alphaproteobacteria bacterium]|nr:phosphate signaling complex protein PhoU [Alphaproteobacteria bacterium]
MASDQSGGHIVKSYDDELKHLNNTIIEMGGLTEAQTEAAIQAFINRDVDLAYRIIDDDDRIDELNYEVDNQAMRLLALRQPMAFDLRNVVAALKISADLERIADYATNIARRTVPLSEAPTIRPVHVIPRMGRLVMRMMKNVIDAYIEQDAEKAVSVWHADEEVDEMYVSLFRELLTYMMEDTKHITPCTHVLFIAKNIERMGDHVTNVCETIYFLVHGTRLRENRERKTQSDRLLTDIEPEE